MSKALKLFLAIAAAVLIAVVIVNLGQAATPAQTPGSSYQAYHFDAVTTNGIDLRVVVDYYPDNSTPPDTATVLHMPPSFFGKLIRSTYLTKIEEECEARVNVPCVIKSWDYLYPALRR